MCMLSRLDRVCTRIPSISEIRGMFFSSSNYDIFETFCILYHSLLHFPLRLSPKILNICWNDLAIMFTVRDRYWGSYTIAGHGEK